MFVKGLAKGLGIEDYRYVNSPAFVIIKEYRGRLDLYHFDVYRLDQEGFTSTLDYRRYFYGGGVTVVEWADRIKDTFPDEYLEISIGHVNTESGGLTKRQLEFHAQGDKYTRVIEKL